MIRALAAWLVSGAFLVCVAYLLLCGVYLNLLVVAARRYKPLELGGSPTHSIVLLVPAHNEASIIEATLHRLNGLQYPAHLLRTIVIADNCTDDTAERAAAAGSEVWVRTDPLQLGKGAALGWGIGQLGSSAPDQAVAVLDADTVATTTWLLRAETYLRSGAKAVQSFYGIDDAAGGWRAQLMTVAFLLFHHVRSAGRSALGWSAGLKGNGMVLRRDLLDAVPWSGVTITEDLEYASQLAARDISVAYDGGSKVLGLAGATRAGVRSQRLRWEGGRFRVLREWGPLLLRRAVAGRSLIALDGAMELFILPLGLLTLVALGLLLVSGGFAAASLTSAWWPLAFGLAVGLIGLHVLGGMWVGRAPARLYAAVAYAPVYLVWKIVVYLWLALGVERNRWIRTDRSVR